MIGVTSAPANRADPSRLLGAGAVEEQSHEGGAHADRVVGADATDSTLGIDRSVRGRAVAFGADVGRHSLGEHGGDRSAIALGQVAEEGPPAVGELAEVDLGAVVTIGRWWPVGVEALAELPAEPFELALGRR